MVFLGKDASEDLEKAVTAALLPEAKKTLAEAAAKDTDPELNFFVAKQDRVVDQVRVCFIAWAVMPTPPSLLPRIILLPV